MKRTPIKELAIAVLLCIFVSVKAQKTNKDTLDKYFTKAELAVNQLFGFDSNVLGLSKEKLIELNNSSKQTTPFSGYDLSFVLKDGVAEVNYKFDEKNKCVKFTYAKPDDKNYETVYKLQELLDMKKSADGSGYTFEKSNYLGEVFWSKSKTGQLVVYNFVKTTPIEKAIDKNGIEGTWSGSYSKSGTSLLNGESFVFTKMKEKDNEYWCRYLSSNGPERKFGAHYENGEIRIYGSEDRTFIVLIYDSKTGKMIASSKGGKDVYFVKLSD